MVCHNCQAQARKAGRDKYGRQRYKCRVCRRYSTEPRTGPLGEMRIDPRTAALALSLIVEGNSVRATARLTGLHKGTILKLLVQVGEQCERLMAERIAGVKVGHVEVDELWTFVGAKQRTASRKGLSLEFGDCYTFLAIEQGSKLILCSHTGRRSTEDGHDFMAKVARATGGRFALSSDAWPSYADTVEYALGARVDYCQVKKEYVEAGGEELRRYGPPRLLRAERIAISGDMQHHPASTSHVERCNWTVRTDLRRFTRLSNGFSRKRENLRAAVALWVAYYNFVKYHSTVRMPPAVKAGIVRRPWTMADLIREAATC